jgi:hypothetical protein
MFKDLQKEIQDIDLTLLVAEANQTFDLITSVASRLIRGYSALRSGKLSKVFNNIGVDKNTPIPYYLKKKYGIKTSRQLKSVYRSRYRNRGYDFAADAWLELQFGWKPLLSDVDGAAKALAKHFGGNQLPFIVARGYCDTVFTRDVMAYDNIPLFKKTPILRTSLVTFIAKYDVDDPVKVKAQSLGLANPVNTAWQLIPFSFVADYFYPIGDYLGALSASNGLVPVDGSLSWKHHSKFSAEAVYTDLWPDWINYSAKMLYENEYYVRKNVQVPDGPPLPVFEFGQSLTRCTNMIALVKKIFL